MHVDASKSSQHSAWQWQPQAAFILLISFYKGVADTWLSGCNPRHVLPDKVMQIYKKWLAEADGSKRLVPCLQDTEIPEGFSCLQTLPGFSHRVPINVHPFRRNLRSYTKLQIKKWFSMHLTDLIEHKDRKDSNTSCSKLPNHKIWLGEGLPPSSKRSSTRTLSIHSVHITKFNIGDLGGGNWATHSTDSKFGHVWPVAQESSCSLKDARGWTRSQNSRLANLKQTLQGANLSNLYRMSTTTYT